MVTDPISDFIIRLQNASRVKHEQLSLPFSQIKFAIAKLLEREGYLADVAKPKKGEQLSVNLVYKNGTPAIAGVKRISKPSRRVYLGAHALRPVKHGHGLLLLSTPEGILTGKDAHKQNVGGEALFEIW